MDILSIVNFLTHVVSKDPMIEEKVSFSDCTEKLSKDLSRQMFSISNDCFDSIRGSNKVKVSQADYLIAVGYKKILILKQNLEKNVPMFSIISGNNSRINDIDFIYPVKNTHFLFVKNKYSNELLVFDYKIAGNITPLKVLNFEKLKSITKIEYDPALQIIVLSDLTGKKEILRFSGKEAI